MAARLIVDGRRGEAPAGAILFDLAEELGVHVPTSCRKQGKCRECLVEIEAGAELLSPRAEQEDHLPEAFRLACRTAVAAREGAIRCHTMRRGAMRIETAAIGLPGGHTFEPRYRRRGGELLRDGEVVGAVDGVIHGVAIDLGTTTVAASLVDLEDGRVVATQSFENPQRFGGSDVMARIRYDTDHPGRLLQRVFLGYLARALEAFPCDLRSIVELVVAGNTTMRDIFFGLDVYTVGQLPYRSITEHELEAGVRATTSLELPARRLRLGVHPDATAYGLPLIGSHVGADAAAVLLATGLAEGDEVAACMDIGTNTEVLVGNRHRLLAASCPAGPAFEGGAVLCGVPGLEGAIERVSLLASGEVRARVIGDTEPIGICGSGLVDLLSELLRTERMNAQGRYTDDSPTFVVNHERRIELTERDVNELAQAKGANAAGLRIVLDRYGVGLGDLSRLYVAGGFGRHLGIAAARRIGLVPDLPDERIVQVGNAALAGAVVALTSMPARRRLEEVVASVEHVELEVHPGFFDYFVDGCQFVPIREGS